MRRLSFCLIGFLTGLTTFAQIDCEANLELAKTRFEEGNIEGIDSLLKPCIHSGFTPELKSEAYKILTLKHIFEDERDSAEVYMQSFLTLDPEYVISSTDDQEFIDLYDEFRTTPIFSIGVIAGGNWSSPQVLNQYGVHTLDESNSYYSSGGVSFLGGLTFSTILKKNLSFGFDVLYKRSIYEYSESFFDEVTRSGSTIQFVDLKMQETQDWVMLPVRFDLDFLHGQRVSPFIGVGASIGYMVKMETSFTRDYNDESLNKNAEVEKISDDLLGHRNRLQGWGLGELGVNFKVPQGNVAVGVRYNMAMFNQMKANTRYDDLEFVYELYFVEDDLRINSLEVFLSYTYKVYKPLIKVQK